MKRAEFIKVMNQFNADQMDGFVSNLDSYFESVLAGRKDMKRVIKKIKDLPYVCRFCAHIDTKICNGCSLPYE